MQLILQNETYFSHILTEIDAGYHVVIPSKGNSMLPFIRPRTDEIKLSPIDNKSIQKGNIVLAKTDDGNYVIHRIEKIDGDTITLRGDGNLTTREYCKKNNILAEYTLRDTNRPIGLAEYKFTESLPENLKTALPSIEELEKQLSGEIFKSKKVIKL